MILFILVPPLHPFTWVTTSPEAFNSLTIILSRQEAAHHRLPTKCQIPCLFSPTKLHFYQVLHTSLVSTPLLVV